MTGNTFFQMLQLLLTTPAAKCELVWEGEYRIPAVANRHWYEDNVAYVRCVYIFVKILYLVYLRLYRVEHNSWYVVCKCNALTRRDSNRLPSPLAGAEIQPQLPRAANRGPRSWRTGEVSTAPLITCRDSPNEQRLPRALQATDWNSPQKLSVFTTCLLVSLWIGHSTVPRERQLIILWTRSRNQGIRFMANLKEALQRLRDARLKINAEKCNFCRTELKYLRHVVTSHGEQTDPEKLQTIGEKPHPTAAVPRDCILASEVHPVSSGHRRAAYTAASKTE